MKKFPMSLFHNHLSVPTLFLLVVISLSQSVKAQSKLRPDDWKLGIQAWSFHLNTFADALRKMDSCGVHYVEAFPPQEIGDGIPGTMDYHMDAATRKKVLELLRKYHIKMVSYGVVNPDTKADWIKLFEFAKAMGLKNIASEPEQSQISFISKLCDKYKINIAIHDHAKPTRYWNPQIVLAAIKGASPRIGACADVGHWLESGLNPIECMKELKGHIIEYHLKDENMKAAGPGFHDVPMGTGVIDMAGIMKEMKAQHFKGYCFIEYEYHFENNVPEVKQCVEYFNREKKKLLQ